MLTAALAALRLPAASTATTEYDELLLGVDGGVKEMLLPHFAVALAQAGVACLVFDYPNFGASTGARRQHIDIAAQQQAFISALDALQHDPRIDGNELGAWGPSLAGGHALTTAARDPRVKAALAIVPFIDLPTRPETGLALAVAGDLVRALLHLPRKTIAIAGAPGQTAAMTSDGALAWVDKITADAPTYRNEVTAASLLQMRRHSTRKDAANVRVPLRVILAEDDTITPAAQARKALSAAPYVDEISFPKTHFELLDEDLDNTVQLTTAWFAEQLLGAPRHANRGASAHRFTHNREPRDR